MGHNAIRLRELSGPAFAAAVNPDRVQARSARAVHVELRMVSYVQRLRYIRAASLNGCVEYLFRRLGCTGRPWSASLSSDK